MENRERLWNNESVPFIVNRISQLVDAGFSETEAGRKVYNEDLDIIKQFNDAGKTPRTFRAVISVYLWVMSVQSISTLKSSHLRSGTRYKLLARESGIQVPDFNL